MTLTIGQRIAMVRGSRGVGEFADALGVNRKTVTRWEADDALPDGASLLALREKFGADPGWLLTGEGVAPTDSTLTADERELLALFRAAPLAVKAAAVGALQGALGAGAGAARIQVGGKVQGQVVEGGLVNKGPVTIGNKKGKK